MTDIINIKEAFVNNIQQEINNRPYTPQTKPYFLF
jgi:hypothetical protein